VQCLPVVPWRCAHRWLGAGCHLKSNSHITGEARLFILDNVLGLPTPPPPPNIPNLEIPISRLMAVNRPSAKFSLPPQQTALRLLPQPHGPLGWRWRISNALGMWRETERKQPNRRRRQSSSRARNFHDIREVKRALGHRAPPRFYRCLTEKMLTYASAGHGIYDTETVGPGRGQPPKERWPFFGLTE